jgi:hypothetical protein
MSATAINPSPATNNTLTLGKVTYAVTHETRDLDGSGPELVYHLHGPRGAHYMTMRNKNRAELMFLLNARKFGVALPDVWLTDKGGILRTL